MKKRFTERPLADYTVKAITLLSACKSSKQTGFVQKLAIRPCFSCSLEELKEIIVLSLEELMPAAFTSDLTGCDTNV